VLQPGGDGDFAEESVGAEGATEPGVEQLERHRPIVPEVVHQVHGGHAAPSQLTFQPVTDGELRCQIEER
jgi:hypothetical protein